jgi:hypothetical protein
MTNIASAISTLLQQAREAGATPEQIKNLRQGFAMQYDWKPTKKTLTPADRKKKSKAQKKARKANRK